MNGDGDLIGLVFDGNWEAMSGDIAFEDELQRTISVDVRYIMWILDKYAGANNLIEEMDFVENRRPKSRSKAKQADEPGEAGITRNRLEEMSGMTREEIQALSPDQRRDLMRRLREEAQEED